MRALRPTACRASPWLVGHSRRRGRSCRGNQGMSEHRETMKVRAAASQVEANVKVFELAALYDASVRDVQLGGRFLGLRDLRPNSDLANYQADEIAKRLIRRAKARQPSLAPELDSPRTEADFRGLPPTEQRVMAILERPNLTNENPDVSNINLKLLRNGLGMSLELAAGTIGVEASDLERWEIDPSTPSWQVRDLLSAYAVHMAAMWGFAQLRLSAQNFEEINRVPQPSDSSTSTRPQQLAPARSSLRSSRTR